MNEMGFLEVIDCSLALLFLNYIKTDDKERESWKHRGIRESNIR